MMNLYFPIFYFIYFFLTEIIWDYRVRVLCRYEAIRKCRIKMYHARYLIRSRSERVIIKHYLHAFWLKSKIQSTTISASFFRFYFTFIKIVNFHFKSGMRFYCFMLFLHIYCDRNGITAKLLKWRYRVCV